MAGMAQKKNAFVSGKVVDENDKPLQGVSVSILGKQGGISSNDSGYFRIKTPADKAFALVFSYTGYKTWQKNFYLNDNEEENITINLERGIKQLETVVVTDQRDRREASLIRINPKNALLLPSAITGVESLIKIFVGSNNELTSNYSVRGGNYDENLVYVNDFEVYRPYLVRSGQQEGLSFINPELIGGNISFYNGGFQSKYGDKMSSVLDIQYKKPKSFGGSAYIGLLEQGLHLEGTSKNNKFSYLFGVRNRSNRNLLSSQETQGNYVPASGDLQAFLTWQISPKTQVELLGNLSQTKFSLIPQFSQPSTSVFSPFFSANLSLDIFFDGREKDSYSTSMAGLALVNQRNKNFRHKLMVSHFRNEENEAIDISGAYIFGERDFDKSKPTFGLIVNPLGAGVFQQFARNKLNIDVSSAAYKLYYTKGKHYLQFGQNIDITKINDQLNEWEFQDSAGYSLPYIPGTLQLNKVLKSKADLNITKYSGYIQDNIAFNDSAGVTLQVGIRWNYNSLNKEWLISPRAGASWKPRHWRRDVIFRASAGAYHQPPFYRELRRYDGTVNTALKAQRSWQAVAGFDYNFKTGTRPFRITTEAYYKSMTNVVPYDIDNVRIRYFGENNAKAYATGVEVRLFGELVKDAESWVSFGLMRTRENLNNDRYKVYTVDSDNQPIDSTTKEGGWLRRPTDRLLTFGMFFQDYLATNKNFKLFINALYGSNLPYNIPNSVRYRNALFIDPYIRVDMGFSALLLDNDKAKRRSHSPFRDFENIWLSVEVFNIVDRANTISYLLIKDFANNIFTIPNRLTPRLINVKLVARF
jgi:CarboxypepD_reg-like domain/TonB-dependent Receptor Plug Domain